MSQDDHARPSLPEEAVSEEPSPTPAVSQAEAMFPYTSIDGLQPGLAGAEPEAEPEPAPAPGPLPGRLPRPPARWMPLVIALPIVAAVIGLTSLLLLRGAGLSPFAPANTPAATVRGYFAALAQGDAAAALGFAAAAPQDIRMLGDDLLAALVEETPITEIDVSEPSSEEPRREVPVSYLLGGTPVTTTVTVVQVDGRWRLERAASEVDLPESLGGLPVLVNGVAIPSGGTALFPGRYTLSTPDARYQVGGAEFTVATPSLAADLGQVNLGLSPSGLAEVVAAARVQLAECVARKVLEPSGCGFAVTHPDTVQLVESTMRWEVSSGADSLDSLTPAVVRAGAIEADVEITVRGTVVGADGSTWRADVTLTRLYADLTGATPQVGFAA